MLGVADTAAAIAVAEAAAANVATAAERAVAWSRAGALRAARGDARGAIEAYRRAMAASPDTRGGLDAARGAHDLADLLPGDRLVVGRTLLAHGGLERGIPMIEAFAAASDVLPTERDEALLEAGSALFDARDYDRAERNLRGPADRIPEAAFVHARAQYRRGRQDAGVRGFQTVAERFPRSAAAADALFVLGDLAHDDGRISAAADYYRRAVATGAHNPSAADAVVRLAGMGLMAADPEAARADLDAYFAVRPEDRVSLPAIYWSGRVAGALGDASGANARFRRVLEIEPFSYYGVLAARRLGTSLAEIEIAEPPALGEALAGRIDVAFFRIDLLREIGLDEEATLELERLEADLASFPAALYAVAEAISEHGQPVAGALLGREIQRATGNWDDRLLRIVFQFPFRDLVVAEARRNGLDPYVVAGLIRQESFFNPVVASPAGAIGLMQVMPSTATGLARRAGIGRFRRSMLTDPATNLRLGTLFLADPMRRWDGRPSDVFAAYNAGPTRVARWRQFPEHSDDEIYVERIPIAETRDYVKRVSLYAEVYRRLYGGR